MSTAIWRKQDDEWKPLKPSGFPSEEKLHDLVQEAPHLLPLAGDPILTVVGREVVLGSGRVDLLAVEADGRPVVIEIKLQRNAEARRAVVAQVLTYAAQLQGMTVRELDDLLRPHVTQIGAVSIADAAGRTDQSGEFDAAVFNDDLDAYLKAGSFRLVLVLDEAPSELVQLVGYLERVATAIAIDVITVSAYEAGGEAILVPARVDPADDRARISASPPAPGARKRVAREADGSEGFEQSIDDAPSERQPALRRLLSWARELETEQLATLRTVYGADRMILLVWVRGEKAGLVSIWNDGGAYISLWRTVFVRLAWDHIAPIEGLWGKAIGQGNTIQDPPPEMLELLTGAYREAAKGQPGWNGRDFYVAFGENEQRRWDEAVKYGFISAGGGEWYSRSLQLLKPGHRVFVYIPKGSGVGGYVGVGTVVGEAKMAKDFTVPGSAGSIAYLDATAAPGASQYRDDPKLAEWVVPVEWIETRSRDDAVKDPDFFANQNSAARLTHGYTLRTLASAFGLPTD